MCVGAGPGTPLVVSAPDGGGHEPAPTLVPSRRAPLRIYAERPRRRWAQLAADAGVVAWVTLVVLLALALHDLVMTLQAPAQGLVAAGGRVREVFSGTAEVAADVPLVGDRLAAALGGGVTSGEQLAAAGDQQVRAVATTATVTAWSLAIALLLPVVPWWLTLRLRWMVQARAVLRMRDREFDADLLALRALLRGSPRRLARRVPGAADGWRRADPLALSRLAAMELERLGLRPGRTVHTSRNGPVEGAGEISPPPGHAPPRTS